MNGFYVEGFRVSGNAKTGISVNVLQCTPTKWCGAHCYARPRDEARAAVLGSSVNDGLVTWEQTHRAFARNVELLQRLGSVSGNLERFAALLANVLKAKLALASGVEKLRGNGVGDLFEELSILYALLASHGIPVYLLSRKADEILRLSALCDAMGIERAVRPWCLGSIDPSTEEEHIEGLLEATNALNGRPVLAYATSLVKDDVRRTQQLIRSDTWKYVEVVFGYHTNRKKTKLGMKKECPATAGNAVKCKDCKRCYGPLM